MEKIKEAALTQQQLTHKMGLKNCILDNTKKCARMTHCGGKDLKVQSQSAVGSTNAAVLSNVPLLSISLKKHK